MAQDRTRHSDGTGAPTWYVCVFELLGGIPDGLHSGFEDEVENSNNARPARDQIQSEERRRTFWACFLMDRTVSDGKERPCIMKAPLPSALRMPSSDADWSAMRASQGARFDPNPPLWSISVDVDLSAEPEADLYGLVCSLEFFWSSS